MFNLIIFVIFLVAVTYVWNPKDQRNKKAFDRSGQNPFQGRYSSAPPRDGNHSINKGSMTRCHNCSSFFPMGRVVHEVVEGHLLEFCSSNCRNNFLAPRR